MNKYLLMSAAAVVASSTAATAAVDRHNSGVQSAYATVTISGNVVTFCDDVDFAWNGANNEILDTETACGSGYTGTYGFGNGIAGKTRGIGPHSDDSDSIENSRAVQLNLDFGTTGKGAPVNGGEFGVYYTLATTSGAIETVHSYQGHYYFGDISKHFTGHKHPALSQKIASKGKTPVVNGLSLKK